MMTSGGGAITMAAHFGWPAVNVLLALVYLPILVLTWKAPEPEVQAPAPRTLREAVWHPFLGFLSQHRALEILAFVLLYKAAEQLTQALTRPFLIDMGYSADHRGIALATVGLTATIIGAFIGGWVTTLIGLGHSLWIFGFLQTFAGLGYYLISHCRRSEPAAHVRRDGVRAAHVGYGHRRIFRAAAARHRSVDSRRRSTRSSPACSRCRGCWPDRSAALSWMRSAGRPSFSCRSRWASRGC